MPLRAVRTAAGSGYVDCEPFSRAKASRLATGMALVDARGVFARAGARGALTVVVADGHAAVSDFVVSATIASRAER